MPAIMRVLTLSRNYPNENFPHYGLWVEGLVRASSSLCEQRVVAPIPYAPPLPGSLLARYRAVPPRETYNGIATYRPRFLTGPGYSFHRYESVTFGWAVTREVQRVRREFPFDLIHAHFIYPEGVVAVKLGQRYRVPVLITEHAMWQPWMDDYPRVRRQALWAVERCTFQIVASGALRDSVVEVTHMPQKIRMIPIGVNTDHFAQTSKKRHQQQILYVGRVQRVKGLDILMKAMGQIVSYYPDIHLSVVGDGLYHEASQRTNYLKELADRLQLAEHITFVGVKTQAEVARMMQECALLVLPSRRESFGTVLVEALACGTPVVATRCGGPQDIVTDKVGVLVEPGDATALAEGMLRVLRSRHLFDPACLAEYAATNFSWSTVARQMHALYEEAVLGNGALPMIDLTE